MSFVMGMSSNFIIAPTFDNLHMKPRSFINPSDTSIQEEAKLDMYSATSNRTLGLKKSDIYSDFLLFCQSFRPLRPFPRVPEIYIRSFGFALDLNMGFLYEYPKTFFVCSKIIFPIDVKKLDLI